MFADRSIKRTDKGIANDLPAILKQVEFYKINNLEHVCALYQHAKSFSNVLPAHRQHGFDFKDIDPTCTVITIVPDRPEEIARRILHIDTWEEEHPVLSKFASKLSTEDKIKFTVKVINNWAKQNILESDITVPISDLYQIQNLGLTYDSTVIDGIVKDMEKFQ